MPERFGWFRKSASGQTMVQPWPNDGSTHSKTFVVDCKKCRRDVPTGVSEFPFQSIVVECPLCGEKRRYLPSELFLGCVDQLVNRQKRAGAV
jgi:hypothetical protein